MPALLRPGFGETLPTLVRERFGIAPRTLLIASGAIAVLAAIVIAVLLVRGRDAQYVHRQDPVFNLVYDDGKLHRADPQDDEVVRLEGGRRRLRLAVTAGVLHVPPYDGNTGKGVLPLVAERRLTELEAQFPDLVLLEEGRSTVNKNPGYQLAYRTGPPGTRTYWREIFVVPDEESPRTGVTLSFANSRPKRVGDEGHELIEAAKSAFRSFTFGEDRR